MHCDNCHSVNHATEDCLFPDAIPNRPQTVKPEGDKRAVASASVKRSAEGVLQASPGEPVTKSPGHQARNRVVDEHEQAIRHLLDQYYGPVPYDRDADVAIARLSEAMGDDA